MLISKSDYLSLPLSSQKRYLIKLQILNLLYNNEVLTVAEIGKRLGFSLPTIRSFLDELIDLSLVVQTNDDNGKTGRTPFKYSFSGNGLFVFVAEVGHSSSRCAIVNAKNELVADSGSVAFNMDSASLEADIYAVFCDLVKSSGINTDHISAVGISMPGLVDSVNGINHTIADESRRDVVRLFSSVFNKPVFLQNDARCYAFGEQMFGLARDKQNSLVVSWNHSIGLGIIVDGNLISGSAGFAGEFSHIRIVNDGELCMCGKRGCLHTVASASYLETIARNVIKNGHDTVLKSRFENCIDQISATDIIDAALKGDEIAIMLLRRLSENLAWGLSILIQLHNPEQIVIGGILSRAGNHVKMPIMLALNQYCLGSLCDKVTIDVALNDDELSIKGLAASVFDNLFHSGFGTV
jgi:predicted NBD/HSP70 family sugar kinase